MMKKKLVTLCLTLLMVLGLWAVTASAVETSGACGDDLTWSFADGVLTVTGSGKMTSAPWSAGESYETVEEQIQQVVLPEGLTSIYPEAFQNCINLTSVNIPSTVTEIRNNAFWGCEKLESIQLPAGLTTLGGGVFYNCKALQSVNIPDGIQAIYGSTFQNCASLQEIVIPDGVIQIDGYAFAGCKSLAGVEIPDSVADIMNSAFHGCVALTEIHIPEGVAFIRESVFAGCTSLTKVDIPDSVTWIMTGAFSGCTALEAVTIGNSVEKIDTWAFSGCVALAQVEIPASVTQIGQWAFMDCTGLEELILHEGLQEIGPNAFEDSDLLKTVEIPSTVTWVRPNAFCALEEVVVQSMQIKLGDHCFGQAEGPRTLTGYIDSAAQDYAAENGFTFIPLDVSGMLPFTDVPSQEYYATGVLWAVQHGVTTGDTDTTFGPEKSCTRAQVVTFLWRAMGKPEPTSSYCPFVDVDPNGYYYKAVLWASKNGITQGKESNLFDPDGIVTRKEFVTFLYRTIKPRSFPEYCEFVDVAPEDYYFKPVVWAVSQGITKGVDDTHFGPDETCTRGQVVTFLYRALGKTW